MSQTPRDIAELRRRTRRDSIGREYADVPQLAAEPGVVGGRLLAIITSSTAVVTGKQWLYNWSECEWTLDGESNDQLVAAAKTGGQSGSAYNTAEIINSDASGMTAPYGNGVYPGQMDPGGTGTDTHAIAAVPIGTPVWLTPIAATYTTDDGEGGETIITTTQYIFQYSAYPVTGECNGS